MGKRPNPIPVEAYATNLQARDAMIWKGMMGAGDSTVKDPIAYLARIALTYGPIVKEAAGIAYEYINVECYAVCADKIDERLSAKYGWESKTTIRNREIAELKTRREAGNF